MEQMSFDELMMKYQKMQQENISLKNEVSSLQQENANLKVKVENQQLQINVLNRYVFGSKRESTPKQEENIVERNSMFYLWCARRRRN